MSNIKIPSINSRLNKLQGKRIPKDFIKRGVNLTFLFDEPDSDEKYPYVSNLCFYDGAHLIGTTCIGQEDRNVKPSIRQFLNWYQSNKPVGYTEFSRDGILRCLNYAYDLRPYLKREK